MSVHVSAVFMLSCVGSGLDPRLRDPTNCEVCGSRLILLRNMPEELVLNVEEEEEEEDTKSSRGQISRPVWFSFLPRRELRVG